MPKRKRDHHHNQNVIADTIDAATDANNIPIKSRQPTAEESARSISIQQKVVEQKLYHGKILVKRGLKLAKGFEQQKLGKRLKAARNGKGSKRGKDGQLGADDIGRLEGELEALKVVDLAELAEQHLHKVVLKNRALANSPYLPSSVVVAKVEDASQGSGIVYKMNVAARLYNANPVKEAVAEALVSVKSAMGVEESATTANATKKEPEMTSNTRKSHDTESDEDEQLEDTSSIGDEASQDQPGDVGNDLDDSWSTSKRDIKGLRKTLLAGISLEALNDDDENEVGDMSDSDYIAMSQEGSEIGADDDEQKNEDDEVRRGRGHSMSITPNSQLSRASSPLSELSDSASITSELPETHSKPSMPAKPNKANKQPHIPAETPSIPRPTTSSFLPSLMSGYISGSDSDITDNDDSSSKTKKKGPPTKKIRKNRMGQQARRALAERKFGREANHVKLEEQAKMAKEKKKEEKRKAWTERLEKPVHPSWQAKKDAKEAKSEVVKNILSKGNGRAGVAPVLGKKIVFD